MEFIGEADLTIRCIQPFYRRMTLKSAIHISRDLRKDQVVITIDLSESGLSIAEIDVTILGVLTRYSVYSSTNTGSQYQLYCYVVPD
ncbi:hypothetical protein [Pseudomonas sp. efr-133-TYG-5]|jgi:PIN domain nuclease of toxin-antitoxin system|uniref:hypothetical protein n=1 Tax=Pseudomonas sp. efr-133-TYG-5 TaxID=3040310 RepID=UPI002552147C|nr:hypothetical protein [Pseudomonas sp. efr-133-TYG-5]